MILLKFAICLVVAVVVVPVIVGGFCVYVGWADSYWPVELTARCIMVVIFIAMGWLFGKIRVGA